MAAERRSWWRGHFFDHPRASIKSPDAYVASDSGQTKSCKVYCKLCLIVDVQQIMKEDLDAIDQGRRNAVRTENEIEIYCELINSFVRTA